MSETSKPTSNRDKIQTSAQVKAGESVVRHRLSVGAAVLHENPSGGNHPPATAPNIPWNKGSSPHGYLRYRRGCRCLTCRRDESLRVRAAYERSCDTCGGPTWGTRCAECRRLAAA